MPAIGSQRGSTEARSANPLSLAGRRVRVRPIYRCQPAPPSPFEWGNLDRIRERLGKNFDLRFEKATSFYREPTSEAAWRTFSIGYGPTRSLAESLDGERREALHRDFLAFHAKFATDLGITVPREYVVTVGVRK